MNALANALAVDLGRALAEGGAAERARHRLREYVRQAWHVVEPSTPYVHGWHIDAMCEHLEAVTAGEIRNLLINVPPRHMKSLTIAVFWPTWEWLTHPERRWLFSSYALSLAIRDSLKCRRLILSPWYQRNFGHIFTLTDDQNAKLRFENDRTGYRLSTSVGGAATGEGGDRLVCDDPHNVREADSDAVREATLVWWDEVMATRLNDPATGAKVIVMQRVHENDLAGHVLEQGGYEHLCLPAEYEPTTYVTGIGWLDPRTEPDELLWPERVGPDQIADLKVRLGSYAYAGQFQQRPAPRGGGLFKRSDFRIVDAAPAQVEARVRYWDKAGTEGGGAYSAGVCISRGDDGMFYVEDVVRGQWSSHQRNVVMQQTAALDGHATATWVEQEPGSGGKESAEFTLRLLAGYDVHAERPTGDKVTRARPFAAQVEAGNVALVRGAWNAAYLDELALVPHGKYWDQTDASAGAFTKLATEGRVGVWLA